MNSKIALVTGISGQDGYYMAEKLTTENYKVVGLTHNSSKKTKSIKSQLKGNIEIREFDYFTVGLIKNVIDQIKPQLIFNFASRATGQGMFEKPYEMSRLNGGFVLDILESMRVSERSKDISFCQSSSSEMFGDVIESPQTEKSAFNPISPYGAAKLYAHNMVKIYRSTYDLKCCSAILYNHESVRRSDAFVTKKIASYAAKIHLGLEKVLTLGDLSAQRDWGFAPEYVNAMYLMAINENPKDFVVSTGTLSTVADLCESAFSHLNLDYRQYVQSNSSDKRINKSMNLHGNPEKIYTELGWRAEKKPQEIMQILVDFEVEKLKNKSG